MIGDWGVDQVLIGKCSIVLTNHTISMVLTMTGKSIRADHKNGKSRQIFSRRQPSWNTAHSSSKSDPFLRSSPFHPGHSRRAGGSLHNPNLPPPFAEKTRRSFWRKGTVGKPTNVGRCLRTSRPWGPRRSSSERNEAGLWRLAASGGAAGLSVPPTRRRPAGGRHGSRFSLWHWGRWGPSGGLRTTAIEQKWKTQTRVWVWLK